MRKPIYSSLIERSQIYPPGVALKRFEYRTIKYKGKDVTYLHEYWLDCHTGDKYTTTDIDIRNIRSIKIEYNNLN